MEGKSNPSASTAPNRKPQTESAKPPGYKPKSQGKLLMEITAVSGEYPADNIPRMILATSYAKKVVSALIGDKLIKLVSYGGLKGYRLTPKGKRTLVTDNPARFAGFLDGAVETNKMRTGYERRLRLHSLAEVCTLMNSAGVMIFQDVKPKVYLSDTQTAPSQPIIENSKGGKSPKVSGYRQTDSPSQSAVTAKHPPPTISAPCFYTSREQKGQEDNAIRGSRAAGTLLTPTQIFAIYNTGRTESRWSEKTEQRFKAEVETNISRKLMVSQYEGKAISGIMIGRDMETLEKYLTVSEKEKIAYAFLTKVYQSFYYITNDRYGEAQLRILCDENKMLKLKYTLLTRLLPHDKSHAVENDAMTEDGNPVLFCCLLNFPRLIRFRNGITLQNKTGKVIAFDFQMDMLKRYLGDAATFVQLDFDKLAAQFFQDD